MVGVVSTTNDRRSVMDNIKLSQEGNELIIRIDVSKRLGLSKSEKSETVASTRGNKGIIVGDTEITLGVNAFIKV